MMILANVTLLPKNYPKGYKNVAFGKV